MSYKSVDIDSKHYLQAYHRYLIFLKSFLKGFRMEMASKLTLTFSLEKNENKDIKFLWKHRFFFISYMILISRSWPLLPSLSRTVQQDFLQGVIFASFCGCISATGNPMFFTTLKVVNSENRNKENCSKKMSFWNAELVFRCAEKY